MVGGASAPRRDRRGWRVFAGISGLAPKMPIPGTVQIYSAGIGSSAETMGECIMCMLMQLKLSYGIAIGNNSDYLAAICYLVHGALV